MRTRLNVRYDVHCMSDDEHPEHICLLSNREFSSLADVQLEIDRGLANLADWNIARNWRQWRWRLALRIRKGAAGDGIPVAVDLHPCGEGPRPSSFTLADGDRHVVLVDNACWHTARGAGDCADAPGLIATWLDLHLGTEAKVKLPLRPPLSEVETAPPTLLHEGGRHV